MTNGYTDRASWRSTIDDGGALVGVDKTVLTAFRWWPPPG
jgi:hypothetical protein